MREDSEGILFAGHTWWARESMGSPHAATRHPSFTGFGAGHLCKQRLDLAGRLDNWLCGSIEGHSHNDHMQALS